MSPCFLYVLLLDNPFSDMHSPRFGEDVALRPMEGRNHLVEHSLQHAVPVFLRKTTFFRDVSDLVSERRTRTAHQD